MVISGLFLRRFLLAAFVFLGLCAAVFPQNAGYFVGTETGEPRFFQRLAWRGGGYALRYEVVIERDVNGTYRGHAREFTTALYIDVSLPPGKYRFRVIPYDVLNRPGEASEWKYIEVLPALKPALFAARPEYVPEGTSGGPSGYVINISGSNISPGAEVFIRRADGERIVPETLDSGDGNSVRVFVESDKLIPGEYEIVIINPGGLEASIAGVRLSPPGPEKETAIGLLKPALFSIGLAWIPSLPAYGDYLKGGSSVFGITALVNMLFLIPTDVYIGPELSVLYYTVDYPYSDSITAAGFNLRLLARKWFTGQRAALSFRAGVNYETLLDNSDKINAVMGASLLLRFANNELSSNDLLLEGGLDYSHIFSETPGGLFRPWLGISFQF